MGTLWAEGGPQGLCHSLSPPQSPWVPIPPSCGHVTTMPPTCYQCQHACCSSFQSCLCTCRAAVQSVGVWDPPTPTMPPAWHQCSPAWPGHKWDGQRDPSWGPAGVLRGPYPCMAPPAGQYRPEERATNDTECAASARHGTARMLPSRCARGARRRGMLQLLSLPCRGAQLLCRWAGSLEQHN